MNWQQACELPYYNGTDLGANYTPAATTFKLWAPTAAAVTVELFATGTDAEPNAHHLGAHHLQWERDGVWSLTLSGDWKNTYYLYHLQFHDGRTADDRADELRLFLTQIPGNEDRDAHGQLGDDEGDEVEHLAAGGDRRQADGGAEPAHDQQVYRAIGRLQHQCAQDGEHEGSQLFQDAALRKIVFLRSQGKFSFRKTLDGMHRWCG